MASQDDLEFLVEVGDQPSIARDGKVKPLRPMSGYDRGDPTRRVTQERLLENADSYAWAARRIWKRKRRQ
jgi:hypothetical protein